MARIVFMGTPGFAVPILERMISEHDVVAVITGPDEKAGRGRRVTVSPVKSFALSHCLPVLQPTSMRQPDIIENLRSLKAEIFVVAAYGQILPVDVLAVPRFGSLNVHASLLPRYRGASPIAHAILRGETRTGVTVMLMDKGMDTGPIVAQHSLDIEPDDTTGSLSERLAKLGRDLLAETIPLGLSEAISPRPQNDGEATYAGPLKKSDGLIDWSRDAEDITRRCRAFHPWPGSYTFWRGRQLKLLQCRALPGEATDAQPGSVLESPEGVSVVTGHGFLLLEVVQLSGRRVMRCSDFACGQRAFVGSVLGAEGEG